MTTRRVDAVLLDIDDTLVDTRYAFGVAIAEVVAAWLPHLDDAGAAAALVHWTTDASGHFQAYTRGEIDFLEQRRRRAAALHASYDGPDLDAGSFAIWNAQYEEAFSHAWRLCPDAAALLDLLDAAGLPYGAVTNAGLEYQRGKLSRVGLGDRLTVIIGTDAFGVGKPDPRLFLLGCQQLGVEPARTAYVGDELEVDARGARNAGLLGVWLDRRSSDPAAADQGGTDPDDVSRVGSLAELPALLGLSDLGAGGGAR